MDPPSVYAFGYMRGHHEHHQTRFFVLFRRSNLRGARDRVLSHLFTLFLFYEILTFSTYPLVAHAGDAKAIRAGRVYLGILVLTSVTFLLTAIIWTYQLCGPMEFTPGGIMSGKVEGTQAVVLIGLFAFGTGKAALMPFHRWLPNAMVAPTRSPRCCTPWPSSRRASSRC